MGPGIPKAAIASMPGPAREPRGTPPICKSQERAGWVKIEQRVRSREGEYGRLTDGTGEGVGRSPPPGNIPATALAGAISDSALDSSGITPVGRRQRNIHPVTSVP